MYKRTISFILMLALIVGCFYPSEVNAEGVSDGTVVQYRYREKEYTSSREVLEDPWMLYDTTVMYEATGNMKFKYVKYLEWSDFDLNAFMTNYVVNSYYRVCEYVAADAQLTTKYYRQTTYDCAVQVTIDGKTYYHYGNVYNGYDDEYYCVEYYNKAEYEYFYYYKWGEWSDWSETAVETTNDREVETREVYTVSYDANGGTAAPASQSKICNEDVVLASDIPTREGYSFLGWSTTANGEVEYSAGGTYSENQSTTLYAVWKAKTYLVSFDANGGLNAPAAQTKTHNVDLIIGMDTPTREGYYFMGWSETTDGVVEYSIGGIYSTNRSITLYAVWEVQPSADDNKPFSWTLDEEGTLTVSGTCTMPNWEEGGAPWYSQKYSIKKIIVESGILSIGDYAFTDCTLAASVNIPSSVELLGCGSFLRCNSIKSISIPSNTKEIGTRAFGYCAELNEVLLSNGICTIGNEAFTHCSQLSGVVLPSTLEHIGDRAFEACGSLTQIIIPDSVTDLGAAAFMDCSNLSSIKLSETISTIPEAAFWYCDSLINVHIPESVIYIDLYAFHSCSNLSSVSMGNQVESIGSYAFSACESIETIIIPDSTTTLYDNCFNSCFNLTSIVLPQSLEHIGAGAFRQCNSLETVYYLGTDTQWDTVSISSDNDPLFSANLVVNHLAFSGASLALQHNLAINYKVDAALFETYGYSSPCVEFEINDEKKTVDTYTIESDRYVFTFCDIAPNQMNDSIYATLYATYDGVEYSSEPREYSVATYCYNMLEKCSSDEYAEFRTLLVDLLHYGAASQIYTDYNTAALVDAQLTDTQLAWGTNTDRTFETLLDPTYQQVETPNVSWKGAGLNLQDSVTMRLKFTTESIDGLTLRIESDVGFWTIASEEFVQTDDGYYAFFNGLNAGQMSEAVYMTFYDGDTPVSNTARYSIESYAFSNQNSEDAALAKLLKAMMSYGDSAYAYVN